MLQASDRGSPLFGVLPIAVVAALAFTAGFADAFAYVHSHIFAANMTGNTVLTGIAAVHLDPAHALVPLAAIGWFVLGSIAGRILLDRLPRVHPLYVEALCLAIAAIVSGGRAQLAWVAIAMGMQNTAIGRFENIKANTSFVTGDFNRIGSALARAFEPEHRAHARKTLGVLVPLVIAYGLGAAAAAALVRHGIRHALLAAIPLVIVCAIVAERTPIESE